MQLQCFARDFCCCCCSLHFSSFYVSRLENVGKFVECDRRVSKQIHIKHLHRITFNIERQLCWKLNGKIVCTTRTQWNECKTELNWRKCLVSVKRNDKKNLFFSFFFNFVLSFAIPLYFISFHFSSRLVYYGEWDTELRSDWIE